MRSPFEGSVLVSGIEDHCRNNCLLVLEAGKARVEGLSLQGSSGMSECNGSHYITENGRREAEDLFL